MRILRAWQTAFLALAAVWGCSFWWMKLGLVALSPLGVAFGRLLLGALALSIALLVSRAGLPRNRRTWGHLAVVAVLLNSVPFTLFAFGETLISSVLAGIINAMTPLATLVVVLAAYPEERPSRDRVIGLVIGFLGVLVVLGVWHGVTSGEAAGALACLTAVTCYGLAYPYVRRHLSSTGEAPLPLATAQVLLGGLILLPVVVLEQLAGRGVVTGPWAWDAVLGMLALGVLGSGLAYVLNFRVIAAAGAATASAVTYLTPVVAVAVGVAVLGEHVAWYQPVGAGIVLAGVAAGQGRFSRSRRTTRPPAPGPGTPPWPPVPAHRRSPRSSAGGFREP